MTIAEQPFHAALCQRVLVAGAGVMGQGIARLFAATNMAVTLMDTREVSAPHPTVRVVRQPPLDAVPDLVIEAVFEDRAVKRSVYAQLEAAYKGAPVLATNTSGLPLDDLAEGLTFPHRFLAMHFFMPADVFPMIEVVRGSRTEDAAVAVAVCAVKKAGREPVLLERPINGYLINRLQHSILHEAYHLIEDGVATAEMIDKVAKRLLGPRMCITGLLEQKGPRRSRDARTGAAIDRPDLVAHERAHSVAAGHGCPRRRRRPQRQGLLSMAARRCGHRSSGRE